MLEDGLWKITDQVLGTLIFDNYQVDEISLVNPDKTPFVTMKCAGFPSMAVWANANGPFVCLEPWMGRCDDYGYEGTLKEKQNINVLEADEVFEKLEWWHLLYWEFSWSAAEGIFMTSEHKFSYDITIPYNNRILLDKMLSIPLEKHFNDNIPKDIIRYKNVEIEKANIVIKDISHTNLRALMTRTYLEVFSKIK